MAFEKIKDDEREQLEKLLYESTVGEYRKAKFLMATISIK